MVAARTWRFSLLIVAGAVSMTGCGRTNGDPPAAPPAIRPSILLVTLDTTRADAVGPDAKHVSTPAFNALASRGRRFSQAYATVPETLPSHLSMMTGLYPAGHAVHENGRRLGTDHPVVAERLKEAGYRTAAFVSSFVLARRFGLARGFDVYDDRMTAARPERTARETTDAVVAFLAQAPTAPLFLWVHYWDPHDPYTPPEPYRTRYAAAPYYGEVAAMDEQLGRLVAAIEQRVPGPLAVLVVGDHGEGLGEHGELLHGTLLYQSTVHVPLVMLGPGVPAGSVEGRPVSARRIYHSILDFAGLDSAGSLRAPTSEVVLGEAMKPFLEYGWQPQIMAVDGTRKSILAGRVETYDVVSDPGETRDLAGSAAGAPRPPAVLRDYPVPSPGAARAPDTLDAEARRSLASLGYVSAGAAPVVRKDAPRPADMVGLLGLLERAAGLFTAERYAQAVPLFERILAQDPYNLDAMLRLASSYSALGRNSQAVAMFTRAAQLAPQSPDVRVYLGLHYVRNGRWEAAAPLLEQAVSDTPDRLAAIEGLSLVRERQGRLADAVDLRRRVYELREPSLEELLRTGSLAMEAGRTDAAIDAIERARGLSASRFDRDLELGVLYLDARRFADARAALDRVRPDHPEYAMALFKRAQVSVLLNEADASARIERARRGASPETRALIARERLFQGR